MSDPLSQIIQLLQPRAVVSKGISGAGRWAVRYSAFGHPGFCALCRQQRPGSRRVVRPHPGNRIKEVDAACNRMAVAD